jgi:hypothetical protein
MSSDDNTTASGEAGPQNGATKKQSSGYTLDMKDYVNLALTILSWLLPDIPPGEKVLTHIPQFQPVPNTIAGGSTK